jgi:hypothetical protein
MMKLLVWELASAIVLSGAALAAGIPDACNAYKPAVTGGPSPPSESDTVIICWLDNAKFEFSYNHRQRHWHRGLMRTLDPRSGHHEPRR